ncbi:MAG TPA: peptide-methionine (S)-S-oxide reductase MsrA [Bacillota bacterium]
MEKATLGGGCFWCLEPVYAELGGVVGVEPGYSGGHVEHPTYQAVCTGTTGHAEVVQITFDPEVISYRDILEVFFSVHDPTTLNRQGADVGTQYRSVIFYHDEHQKQTAEEMIRELDQAGVWNDPIVTRVEPFEAFYPAEDYHREYYYRNPLQPYCRLVINPKLAKFRRKYRERLKQRV